MTGYIVQLEPRVWIATGSGDSGRTCKRSNAMVYSREQDAKAQLTEARKYELFESAKIVKVACY